VQDVSTSNAKGNMQLVGLAGQGGAGKDTLYEQVFRPRGFIRLQMTLYRKIWLVSTGQATWEEVFVTKPPPVRKLLQEDITQVRYDYDEEIWLRVLQNLIVALEEIVCVKAERVAVTDLRFLIEMRGIKKMGGKVLHIEAADQLQNIAPELRGHRSETELQSPEMLKLQDAYLFNEKHKGLQALRVKGAQVLQDWGWV
jgi:dephospho-CoA kinase